MGRIGLQMLTVANPVKKQADFIIPSYYQRAANNCRDSDKAIAQLYRNYF
jgi:hypothetical protein